MTLAPVPTDLSVQELVRLRRVLEECRRERQAQLQALTATPLNDEASPVAVAHANAVREVLDQIERALTRIEDGSYGRCTYCADAIPLARLELLPFTDGCVSCRRRLAER
ncbi:MAG: TraR/DksA family transcriptional regulator [Actinomycetes bacterium]